MTTEQTTQAVGPIKDNKLYRIFFPEERGLPHTTREEKAAAAAEALAVDANHPFDGQESITELMLFSQYLHVKHQNMALEFIRITEVAPFNKNDVDLLAEANRRLTNVNVTLQNACDAAIRTTNDTFNFVRLDTPIGLEGRTLAAHHMEILAVNDHFNDLRQHTENLAKEYSSLVDLGERLARVTPKAVKDFARQSAKLLRPGA